VLVVDDDPDTCEAVKDLLELDGYQVRTCATVEQARAAMARFRPICVLLDLTLPDGSGIDVARRIRALYGDDVVLIVLTGTTNPADRTAAEDAGVDYVLTKPLDVSRLRVMLPRL